MRSLVVEIVATPRLCTSLARLLAGPAFATGTVVVLGRAVAHLDLRLNPWVCV